MRKISILEDHSIYQQDVYMYICPTQNNFRDN